MYTQDIGMEFVTEKLTTGSRKRQMTESKKTKQKQNAWSKGNL